MGEGREKGRERGGGRARLITSMELGSHTCGADRSEIQGADQPAGDAA